MVDTESGCVLYLSIKLSILPTLQRQCGYITSGRFVDTQYLHFAVYFHINIFLQVLIQPNYYIS